MKYSDEDLQDIQRGEPWGVSPSDWAGLTVLVAILGISLKVWLCRLVS